MTDSRALHEIKRGQAYGREINTVALSDTYYCADFNWLHIT